MRIYACTRVDSLIFALPSFTHNRVYGYVFNSLFDCYFVAPFILSVVRSPVMCFNVSNAKYNPALPSLRIAAFLQFADKNAASDIRVTDIDIDRSVSSRSVVK